MPTKSSVPHDAPRIRIALLESEPIRLDGFEALFADLPRYEFVATDVRGLIQDATIRIALVDLHQSAQTLHVVSSIRAARPDVRQIVMGSSTDEEVVLSALAAGAKAYLDDASTFEQVEQALEVVGQGSIWAPRHILSRLIDRLLASSSGLNSSSSRLLTPREEQVLNLLLGGKSNQEIADRLGISCRTVKSHVARLLRKTGADNRIGLSLMAVARSLLTSSAACKDEGKV
jgi:DNA-binding NarL/FixJ family response regulator